MDADCLVQAYRPAQHCHIVGVDDPCHYGLADRGRDRPIPIPGGCSFRIDTVPRHASHVFCDRQYVLVRRNRGIDARLEASQPHAHDQQGQAVDRSRGSALIQQPEEPRCSLGTRLALSRRQAGARGGRNIPDTLEHTTKP